MLSSTYLDAGCDRAAAAGGARGDDGAALEGNPSGTAMAVLARRMVEDARAGRAFAGRCAAGPDRVHPGGTEANNLALKGTTAASVFVSAIEHVPPSYSAGPRIGVLASGRSSIFAALDTALGLEGHGTQNPALVSVMLANNETARFQPSARIVEIARAHGALVHCDAVQAVGRMPVDFAGNQA